MPSFVNFFIKSVQSRVQRGTDVTAHRRRRLTAERRRRDPNLGSCVKLDVEAFQGYAIQSDSRFPPPLSGAVGAEPV